MQYTNPIIRGFNPDPSICRVGKDYYLVTSSFAYFPGIPVYHSRDLVNWKLIGHCVTDPFFLPFEETDAPGGIWAPTIRYHEGSFFVTATFSRHGNFIVSTADPAGPWSAPVWTEVDGIDPSMYFEKGNMYYCTNDSSARRKELGADSEGISMCRMDVSTGKVIGERKRIWSGTGGGWLEAPHVYRIGEYYYLLCAEGGTGLQHMVTAARSKELFGPYESCPDNPILTNRNDTTKQVMCAGHADLFEDAQGHWWLVHLGCRTNINMHSNIGRETFLLPCAWVDGWPRALPDGKCRLEMEGPVFSAQMPPNNFVPDLHHKEWEKQWLFLRGRKDEAYKRGDGALILRPLNAKIDDDFGFPTFLCVRQTEPVCAWNATIRYSPKGKDDEAGLIVYLDHDFNYRFAVKLVDGSPHLVLRKRVDDIDQTIVLRKVDQDQSLALAIRTEQRSYSFQLDGETLIISSSRFMSTDIPDRCFTGTMLGLFCDGTTDLCVERIQCIPLTA